MAFSATYDVVRVNYTSADYARCVTSYGAEITIYWASGKPDPLPRVGESWRVCQYMQGVWQFVSRVPDGQYKYMSYSILLDARSCVGRERVVVDDIAGAGFDGVHVIVANYGEVMWDSQHAGSFGLVSYGDNLTQLVDRFRAASIPITFVIGGMLWPNTTNATHNRYQQVRVSGGVGSYSMMTSWASAADALSVLIGELHDKYGEVARGVCLQGVAYDGQGADFSHGMASVYKDLWGEPLSYDLAEWDYTEGWWEEREKFLQAQGAALSRVIIKTHDKVGNWPLSAIFSENVCVVSDATVKVGQLGTGIPDDIGEAGWSRVGFPITPRRSSDQLSEMRSFEVQVATLMRYARGCKPLPVIKISQGQDFDGELEILAKYGAGEVLLTDYEGWRLLTDDRMIDLSDTMGKYKVYEVNYDDLVGVVLSSSSKDVGEYQLDDIVNYQECFESVCSEIVDKVPHGLSVLFDSDLDDGNVSGVSALVLHRCTNMTDDAVSFVNGLSGVGKVFVGDCGKYVGNSRIERTQNPFADMFSQQFDGTLNYEGEVAMGAGVIDVSQTVYSISDYSVGMRPIFGDTGSTSTADGTTEFAPVVVSGRSAMVGMGIDDEPGLQSAVGELVSYAVGRGH